MTAFATTNPVGGQLPPVNPTTGYLPVGIHQCTWDEFVETFVANAPHSEHRHRRLRALELFVEILDDLLPGSTLWLDGGFVSHKDAAPFDIDVLVAADPAAFNAAYAEMQTELDALIAWDQAGQVGPQPKTHTISTFSGLLTHQDVTVAQQQYFPRVQPFGGYLDTFIFPADASAVLANFERSWSLDFATQVPKGFVEVKPDGR